MACYIRRFIIFNIYRLRMTVRESIFRNQRKRFHFKRAYLQRLHDSYHMTSYHATSYHMIWCHVNECHISFSVFCIENFPIFPHFWVKIWFFWPKWCSNHNNGAYMSPNALDLVSLFEHVWDFSRFLMDLGFLVI